MKSRSLASLVVASVAVIALSASALAEAPANEIVTKVPFEFSAGDQSFPAGSYRLTILRKGGAQEVQIRGEKGEAPVTLVPVTRLARQHMGDAPKSSLVFDKADGKHLLSEVWFPGSDGFLMRATKEEHEHDVVDVKN